MAGDDDRVVGEREELPAQRAKDGVRVAVLRPGDYVLMYTDGVTEALATGDREYGLARMKTVLRKNVGRSAQEIVTEIFKDLADFTKGYPQQDDQTIVVLRRL